MAKLTFFYGAMSSGKTNDLIQTAYKYNSKGMKALVLKPACDTKGENKIVSRIGLEKEVDILIKENDNILDYLENVKDATVLLVDEAQFLNKEQITQLWILTKMYDIPVICYGLRNDFKGNLFKGSAALFCLADSYEKLRSVCTTPGCANNACFNARKVNGEYTYDGPQILIGCDESYDPLCSDCYIKYVLKPKSKDFQKILRKD